MDKERVQYGVIAQELEAVFPEMVQEKKLFINTGDNTSYKTVEYTQLIPVMIEAIKELNAEIEALKKELEEVQALSKRGAFTNIAVLPAFMLICYLGMWLYYRARGGYKPLSLDGH